MTPSYSLLFRYSLLVVLSVSVPLLAQASASQAIVLSGDFRFTHDPSIMQQGGNYYVFATGPAVVPAPHAASTPDAPSASASAVNLPQLPIRCSPDLQVWRRCGAVFAEGIPAWIREASPATKELWAPDISLYDGFYHLYYAYSVFGKNTSGIGLATNVTLDQQSPDYKWVDRGLVLASHATDDYNAIDPNLILDRHGDPWLAFGSFWSGIKMRRLDRSTGKLSSSDTRLYSLATRARPEGVPNAKAGLPPDWQAVEAPFIFEHAGYFYLFVSWDLCCRGTHSTYRTMVGRSHSVHGPFKDREGRKMAEGGGTQLLAANAKWVGPGGESALHTSQGDILAFHAYDAQTGRPALQISTIAWVNGWPSVAIADSAP